MRSFAKESPQVSTEVEGFCTKLLFQNNCMAWQFHMLGYLHLLRATIHTNPNILQPRHSQYKWTPYLIEIHNVFTYPTANYTRGRLLWCSANKRAISSTLKASWAWRGVGIRECVPSRKVFIKPQRGNHQLSSIEIECHFLDMKLTTHERHNNNSARSDWSLSRAVGEMTRTWAAGYNPNKICCIRSDSSTRLKFQPSRRVIDSGIIDMKWDV